MATLSSQINVIVEKEIYNLIKKISIDYKIDIDEIKTKYNIAFTSLNNEEITAELVHEIINEIVNEDDDDEAIVAEITPVKKTRGRKPSTATKKKPVVETENTIEADKPLINNENEVINEVIAVGIHEQTHEIKNPNIIAEDAPKKSTRGRKKKVAEEYLDTTEYKYNGITYLIDDKNNVYTYDLVAPKRIGEKLIDGTVKFIK